MTKEIPGREGDRRQDGRMCAEETVGLRAGEEGDMAYWRAMTATIPATPDDG